MVKRKTNDRIVTVNFEGVETGGGSKVPEGRYEMNVVEVEKKTSDDSGNDYLAWELKIVSPEKYKGKTLYYNTSLQKQSLWNLRAVLEALGVEVPEDDFDIDLDDLVDRTCGAEVQDETYNGKTRSKIVDIFEFTDEGEEVEDEEEEAPKKKSHKASAVEDDEDEAPAKKKRSKKDDEEEEDEAPKKRAKKSKKAATYGEGEILEKDEEELAEVVEAAGLDVELDEFNTLRRKRAAVLEALEGADLLEEEAA